MFVSLPGNPCSITKHVKEAISRLLSEKSYLDETLHIHFFNSRGMNSDQFMIIWTDVTHVGKHTRYIVGVFNLSIDDTAGEIILNQHGYPFPVISFQFLLTLHRKPYSFKTAFLKFSLSLAFHFQWW